MDTSFPPIPPDLWPKVPAATSQRPSGRALSVEIPLFSEAPVLESLSGSIRMDMRCAGEWAARIGMGMTEKGMPSAEVVSRHLTEKAARLLSVYTVIYSASSTLSLESPEALKNSAERSYQLGFLTERNYQQGTTFNDALYQSIRPDLPFTKPPHRPHL